MTEPAPSESGTNLPQRRLPVEGPKALQRFRPVPEEPEQETLSLEAYLQVLRQRKWLLSSVALSVVLLAALQVFTTTPQYTATSQIQIDPENQNILPYEEVESGGGKISQEEYLWTQAEKLQARELVRRVIGKLGLADHPAFTEPGRAGILIDTVAVLRAAPSALFGDAGGPVDERALTAKFLSRLEVRPLRNTRLINVSFESPDAALAARVVNAVTDEFIEQHLESKFDATTRASQFLEKQLESLQIKVEQSEQTLLRYARERNIVNLSDRENIARKRLVDLNDELTRVQAQFIAERARSAAALSAGLTSFPESLKSEAMRGLEARISGLESELARLSTRYGPGWPQVNSLHSEIGDLRQQLDSEKRMVIEGARQDYDLASRRYAQLDSAVEEQRRLVDRLNEDSIQYNILQRESESNKELYEGLLQRLKEAGVAAGLRSSNVRVADTAEVPRLASSPKKGRSLVLALILGLALGTGAAFLMEALDNTLKTTEDVSLKMGLPALGVVPHFSLVGAAKGWKKLLPRRQAAEGPVLVFGDGQKSQRNRALEAYRSLRTSILLSHSGNPPQTILVTSALPGEGKTTTSANTAIALAQTGARTLLVDLDLRKPSIDRLFGIPSEQGMSSYLSGNSDLSSQIRQTQFANLYVAAAGPPAPNPVELIGSARMAAGLQLVRENFTYIVFDTPPSLEISDALVLSPAVDGVILVARSGKTPRKAVARACAQIANVGGELLGVLINDVNLDQPGYGGYYYGSYGGYYGKYFDTQAGESSDSA